MPSLGTAYEERLFAARAVRLVEDHAAADAAASAAAASAANAANATAHVTAGAPPVVRTPFFLYYAFHTSCVGWNASGAAGGEADSLQPDPEYYARFAFVDDADRRANHAMVRV